MHLRVPRFLSLRPRSFRFCPSSLHHSPTKFVCAQAQIEEILEKVRAAEEEREAQRTLRDTRESGFVPNGPHIAFPIADHDIPAVLGRGGATIRQLQEDTGCRINLSKDDGMCYIMNGTEETRKEAQVRSCGAVRGRAGSMHVVAIVCSAVFLAKPCCIYLVF